MTVLFYKDWEEQQALPDWTTSNKSFIELAGLYKQMGVKNYAMILALHDQDLIGVNPHDPNISVEMGLKVSAECLNNIWYWFREIARDPAGSDEYPIQFRANRGIIAAVWLYMCHVIIFLVMIRQTGKSFGIDWLLMWLANVALSRSDISFLTKDDALRSREVERLKGMELTLPYYLKQRSKTDPGNTEIFRIGSLNNTIRLAVPRPSPKLADLVGRGMTAANAFVDEFNYCMLNYITIPVMLSATQAAREVSRLKNEPYGTVFMSTSGKRDSAEGRYGYETMTESAVWTEAFLDAHDQEDLEKMIIASSPGKLLQVNCSFNHRQLGQTDEWLMKRIRETKQKDPIAIRADYFNEWPSGTLTSPFTAEQAEEMRNSETTVVYTEITYPDRYALRWYCPENEIRHQLATSHILAIDPSEAIGSDAIGITLRNCVTGAIVMAADISEGNLIHFCKWLALFLQKYLKITLIIERQSSGATIIDYLLVELPALGIDPFRRIYNQVVQYAEEYPDRFREIQNALNSRENMYDKYKKLFGWKTSGTGATARDALFSRTLSEAVRMTATLMKDRKLILQILGLEIKNGRLDHASGGHDDVLFSWLLSYWLMSLGKNLHYYDIDSSRILSENPAYLSQLKEVSAYDQGLMKHARMNVERLSASLKDEGDEFIAKRLELDLERALGQLSEQDRRIISADDLINKLREERSRNARKQLAYQPNEYNYDGAYTY